MNQYNYAEVILEIAYGKLDHPFTYRIPRDMQDKLQLGSLVVVPFGKGNVLRKGYVVGLLEEAPQPAAGTAAGTRRYSPAGTEPAPSAAETAAGTRRYSSAGTESASSAAGTAADSRVAAGITYKEIAELPVGDSGYAEDPDGAFAVELAAWMKQQYGSGMSTALKTVLASRKPGKPVMKKEIHLLIKGEEAAAKLALYKKKHHVARERLLEALLESPVQPYSVVVSKLHVSAQTIRAMAGEGVIEVTKTHTLRNPVQLDPDQVKRQDIQLSDRQGEIVRGVVSDFDRNISSVSLIHGITGSGKTEVYISIIKEIVARGRQAIMMIPEIALTYQTLMRFYRHFGDRVSVMNSSLSEGEKADQWERARRGEIDVMIGPRSALFTPFERLGVIVIDEEHENSYKNESMPKYHSRDVAEKIVKMKGAVLVLGSATPSLDAYYRATEGARQSAAAAAQRSASIGTAGAVSRSGSATEPGDPAPAGPAAGTIYRLYEMTERLTGGTLPSVEVADMREELRHGNRSILSERLKVLLEDRLAKGEQTMLFLNRRGFSGFVSCRSCGYVVKCPHCDVAMSLHKSGGRQYMTCHYCGHMQPALRTCPECGSPYISGFRAGTEQIEEQLQAAYPQARILRLDADTTAKKGSFDRILSAFANEEADILLGTQMIVKGHDFPKVTLVGVLMADLSLYANDYRAAERTFQLLTQAAGRAGRGELPGDVVIQTYQPDHYAIVHAARQDYRGFYEEEILYRKIMCYPPAMHMMAVQISSASEDVAEGFSGELRDLFDRLSRRNRTGRSGQPDQSLQHSPRQEQAKQISQTQQQSRSQPQGQPQPQGQEQGRQSQPQDQSDRLIVVGPAKASLSRLKDNYRYALYVKSAKYDKLVACKDTAEAYMKYLQQRGRNLPVQIQFDFDPVNGY